MGYHFNIIEKDWYKRRTPRVALTPVAVSISDYKAEHNHMCTMQVTYEDGSVKELIARVIYNKLNHTWTVDGMSVAVKVTQELID
jgi:hypothetical protein